MSRTTCLKRILIFAIEIIILVVFAAVCKVAATEEPSENLNEKPLIISADGDVELTSNDYTYESGVLTIKSGTPVTIKNKNPNESTTDTIVVESGVSANITLENVNIDVSGTSKKAAFKIADGSTGNVNITLVGSNTLKSGGRCAGLQKNEGSGALTIDGTGSLTATGGTWGAGIGSGYNNDESTGFNCSNITINGGKIEAKGGGYAAGIGGSNKGSASNITISGGNVTATSESSGAGIGGGNSGSGSDITIKNNSKVTATGGYNAAGIGGGNGGSGSKITIKDSIVTATSGNGGAGIGGGKNSSGSDITIQGGSVKATGNPNISGDLTDGRGNPVYLLEVPVGNATIVKIDGSEYQLTKHDKEDTAYVYLPGNEHTVEIDGSEPKHYKLKGEKFVEYNEFIISDPNPNDGIASPVLDTDYTYDDNGVLTILTDTPIKIKNVNPKSPIKHRIIVKRNVSANITLAGVNIDSSNVAFTIEDSSEGNVTITLAENTQNFLTSGGIYAGLQKNGAFISEDKGKLTIQGSGSLTAKGGTTAAGIGGGQSSDGSNINIIGGTVIATGGGKAAGIGGGSGNSTGGNGSNINISGGTVIAKGGECAAGIGGGFKGDGSYITISGSAVVTAIGGAEIINNIVSGEHYGCGAGIGGGTCGTGSNIAISGGVVTAAGGSNDEGKDGAGIGGGYNGNGSGIAISGGTITATGSTNSEDIGGGNGGSGSGIVINGGSIKVSNPDNISSSNPTDTASDTDDAHIVHLFEINTGGKPVTIKTANGEIYKAPATHNGENTVYVYLPPGSKINPNLVTINDLTFELFSLDPDNNDSNKDEWFSNPVITPTSGTFTDSLTVTITCIGENLEIYYTKDNTDPTTSSTKQLYNGAFEIAETTIVKAIAVKNGVTSEVVTAEFKIQPKEESSEPTEAPQPPDPPKPPQPIQPIQPTQPPTHEQGSISKDVQLGTNALKTEIATSIDDLADIVLTDKDQSKVDKGIDIKIILTVDDVTQTISEEDKSKIEAEISELSYNTPGVYLDVSLMKVVGEVQEEITETGDPITLIFDIPEAIRSKNRVYAVLRVHNGETAILPDLDEDENTVTVQTDKFSTYTVIYKDIELEGNGDLSGDSSDSSTSGDFSDGSASGDSIGGSSDGSNTNISGDADNSDKNPNTGGIRTVAAVIFAAAGVLAAALACASKGKK